jgi:hypothetical protein
LRISGSADGILICSAQYIVSGAPKEGATEFIFILELLFIFYAFILRGFALKEAGGCGAMVFTYHFLGLDNLCDILSLNLSIELKTGARRSIKVEAFQRRDNIHTI